MDILDDHFLAFPAACKLLVERSPFTAPEMLAFDAVTGQLQCTLAGSTFTLDALVGDAAWLVDAHRLGGLQLRCMPHPTPGRITLFASWEEQCYAISGVPVA
jgi:hypothetical protein